MNHAECPKCNPLYPELDEQGRPYTCFFCGDTGYVSEAVAQAYYRDIQDWDERFAPRCLGVFLPGLYHHPDFDFDPDVTPSPGSRLFTRLIPEPRPQPVPALAGDMFEDDIPF